MDAIGSTYKTSSQPNREEQVKKKTPKRGLILIKGYSGTGKTTLAKAIRSHVVDKHRGLFIIGKYDLYIRDEPYYGIGSACRSVCGELLALRQREMEGGPIRDKQLIFASMHKRIGATDWCRYLCIGRGISRNH